MSNTEMTVLLTFTEVRPKFITMVVSTLVTLDCKVSEPKIP